MLRNGNISRTRGLGVACEIGILIIKTIKHLFTIVIAATALWRWPPLRKSPHWPCRCRGACAKRLSKTKGGWSGGRRTASTIASIMQQSVAQKPKLPSLAALRAWNWPQHPPVSLHPTSGIRSLRLWSPHDQFHHLMYKCPGGAPPSAPAQWTLAPGWRKPCDNLQSCNAMRFSRRGKVVRNGEDPLPLRGVLRCTFLSW